MWVRIFYKGSKYKGAVKAAFCDIESNDLMWHDFFWIKHYGAKKPVPEKLARKAKRVGFAQPGEWRHGVRTYFSWRKERQMSFDRDLALGNKKGVIDLGNKTRTNRCRDPITQGLFYDNLLRKPLWSSP